ncbi:MAG TPA: helicase-related protein [Chloroflexota bacterium]|nr:helicase-related protein [Chloroflexota bacterium]
MSETYSPGTWLRRAADGTPCRIVEVETLWGQAIYTVWLPAEDRLERLPASGVCLPDESTLPPASQISYVAAAARILDATQRDEILAPLQASVIPLPHQIHALKRAITGDDVRFLLADEVGLGKTIEAGLILQELKLRGLVRRALVVAPRGLVTQWVAEMRTHFGEEFHLIQPGEALPHHSSDGTIWRAFDQVVCPMDSVKPIEARRGWSPQQLAEYNRPRFDDLIDAGWDLIIVDEAHRLAGSSEYVARYRLGQGLSAATPYLLLLSATPHNGKSDAFHRLITLLDERAFPDTASVVRERVRPYVIRTEKRHAVDSDGKALFRPRHTRMLPVRWDRHADQQRLYEAVTEYVREGYNAALQDRRRHIGFLMILMQRLVSSSTAAIRSALERRRDALREPDSRLSVIPASAEEEWEDLDAAEQAELVLQLRQAFGSELDEIERLLALAERAEARGPDAKAEELLAQIYALQRAESDPHLKVLIFTEFVATQEMLASFLADRGFSAVCLNGSMDLEARGRVQSAFARDAQILISTDAGGEGLNLQFCHVVVNYDIPWNPMRLEQRIGRVDRIGQTHAVQALNLVLEESVEHRVRDVLEEKLAVILHDLGVDKTGDVLDSAQAGTIFDDLYLQGIVNPEGLEERIGVALEEIRRQGQEVVGAAAILGTDDPAAADARDLTQHPLPHWVERMTVSYLGAHGACEQQGGIWALRWPDGTRHDAVFTAADAARHPQAERLSLDNDRVRRLVDGLPRLVEGDPVPSVRVEGLPASVAGYWSLWRITARAGGRRFTRLAPMFRHDNGRVFLPTAQFIWDALIAAPPTVRGIATGETAAVLTEARQAMETHGEAVYGEMIRIHRERLEREREKGHRAFTARRRAIERLGLPAVRARRLAQLEIERWTWQREMAARETVTPDLEPVSLLRIEAGDAVVA